MCVHKPFNNRSRVFWPDMGGGGKVMTCDCCDKSLIRRIVPSGQPRRSRSVTRLQTQDSGHSPTCKTHITLFFCNLYFLYLSMTARVDFSSVSFCSYIRVINSRHEITIYTGNNLEKAAFAVIFIIVF